MFEFLSELENLPSVIICWLFTCFLFWFLPKMAGTAEWSLQNRLLITVLGLPISYFIVNHLANK